MSRRQAGISRNLSFHHFQTFHIRQQWQACENAGQICTDDETSSATAINQNTNSTVYNTKESSSTLWSAQFARIFSNRSSLLSGRRWSCQEILNVSSAQLPAKSLPTLLSDNEVYRSKAPTQVRLRWAFREAVAAWQAESFQMRRGWKRGLRRRWGRDVSVLRRAKLITIMLMLEAKAYKFLSHTPVCSSFLFFLLKFPETLTWAMNSSRDENFQNYSSININSSQRRRRKRRKSYCWKFWKFSWFLQPFVWHTFSISSSSHR